MEPWGEMMVVTLPNGVHWIEECFDLGSTHAPRRHKHVSVYVVPADRPILVDSGSFLHRDAIVDGVNEATDGTSVGTVILSHSDYPHAANVREFAGPDGPATLVASSGAPEKQGLPDAQKCEIGSTMSFQGDRFTFIDPPLADRSHSTWIFHHESGTLFTADGFGSRHPPDRCLATSREFDDGIPAAAIHEYHQANLPWLRYVDPSRLEVALRDIIAAHDVAWIAPIHGHPIAGADLDRYIECLIEAAGEIVADANPMDGTSGTRA